MKLRATACAIKRTSITVGTWILGVVLGTSVLLIISSVLAFIFNGLGSAFPVLHQVFPFLLLTGFIAAFLFVVIYGISKEYGWNYRVCKEIEDKKKNRGG